METLPELYPLTSLQIGDIRSYKAQVFLYFATSTGRLLILVDNRPWSLRRHSRSMRLWQLMVTKYRVSPFINTRALARGPDQARGCCLTPDRSEETRLGKLVRMVKAVRLHRDSLFSFSICKALSGFLVFDLSWRDVHGIKYSNELQTDTSLALEVQSMRKWEFTGIEHAIRSMPSWFHGSGVEEESLATNLRKLADLNIHLWIFVASSKCALFRDTSLLDSCCRGGDLFHDAGGFRLEPVDDSEITERPFPVNCSSSDHHLDSEEDEHSVEPSTLSVTPIEYKDNMLLLSFSDTILPFKLRQVLTPDPRLLRLLEFGLPSWVIFFQSYPLFCHLYRPWIRHLSRAIYVFVSLSTFLIAFFDLYKKVPLLKAGIAMVFGPVFDWIERWEMASRIQYLGTMIFLQNSEKAVQWLVAFVRAVKPLVAVIKKPFARPLKEVMEYFSPVFHAFAELGELLLSTMWLAIDYLHDLLLDSIHTILLPFEYLYSFLLDTSAKVQAAALSILGFLHLLTRPALSAASYIVSLIEGVFGTLKSLWHSIEGALRFLANSFALRRYADEMSIWRELWHDSCLFCKQAFLAVRSIATGLLAIFLACYRFLLSVHDYVHEHVGGLAHGHLLAQH